MKALNTTEELVYEFDTSNVNIYPAVILYGCVTFQVEAFQRETFSFFSKYHSFFSLLLLYNFLYLILAFYFISQQFSLLSETLLATLPATYSPYKSQQFLLFFFSLFAALNYLTNAGSSFLHAVSRIPLCLSPCFFLSSYLSYPSCPHERAL